MISHTLKRLRAKWAHLDPRRKSEDYRRSLRNALLNSGEGLLTPLLWLISTPLFIGKLGAEHFGIWMLVNGFIGVGGVFSFGLTEATIKYVSKYRALHDAQGVQRIIRATLLIYALLGLGAALLACGLAGEIGGWVFKSDTNRALGVPGEIGGWVFQSDTNRALGVAALRIGGVGILLRFLDSVFQSVLQGYERYDLNSKVGMMVNAVTVTANLVLVYTGCGLLALLWTTLGVLGLGSCVKAMLICRTVVPGTRLLPYCSRETFRELISFGFYNWLQNALSLINANLDKFLIAGYLSPAAVTYYTVCFQLVGHVHAILVRAASFLFPFASLMFERGDHGRLKRIYHKSSLTIVVLATAMVFPIYVLGDSILAVWLKPDPEFAEKATLILRIFCVRYALTPMGIVNYNYLLAAGLVKFQALIVGLTAPTTILGMFLLIPSYGAVGAAAAHLLSLPYMLFSRFFIEKKLFNELNVRANLSYFVPVVIPFALATFLVLKAPLSVSSLPLLVLLLGVLTVSGGALSYGLGQACRRLGWMPS